jgi:hypothetical protein
LPHHRYNNDMQFDIPEPVLFVVAS